MTPDDRSYLELRLRRPRSAWPVARALSVAATVALAVALVRWPATGLLILWGLVVPALPALFMLAPGLWRNVCPMAALNQVPRVLGITRGLALPRLLERHGYAVGAVVFLGLVSTRKLGLEESAAAGIALLCAALGAPLLLGFAFKGKSGFCGGLCPLRPIQGVYGQTPFATVRNSHCRPCVGCTTNCTDLKPATGFLDDVRSDDPYRAAYRKLFAGALPGFIVAMFTAPQAGSIGDAGVYGRFALYALGSLGLFYVLDSAVRLAAGRVTALFGAASFALFYFFSAPAFAGALERLGGFDVPEWAVWEGRGLAVGLASVWLVRTMRKVSLLAEAEAEVAAAAAPAMPKAAIPLPVVGPEPRVVDAPVAVPETASDPGPAPGLPPEPAPALAAAPGRPMAGDPPVPVPDRRSRERRLRPFSVTILPEGRTLEARPGATLLEVAEGNAVGLEPGCRMGLCGCDPVYVLEGMENLSAAGQDERATIERLGFPQNTRMACATRVQGDVVISLDENVTAVPAEEEEETAGSAVAPAADAPADVVRQVVIVGNGIAGVTAADHVRRHHAECEIHLLTTERHPFYNRTSVSRLIHSRAGMQRMYLLPDSWYDERRITCWLNTGVSRVDRDARHVVLGTGETLDYDRLVLATGGSAFVPPIEGIDLDGCFTLREADDAMRVRAFAQRPDCRRAVVAGGGVLGLEAADALRRLGLEVTVVERDERLAPAQLDDAAADLLRTEVEGRGIDVILGTSISVVRGGDHVTSVELGDGSARGADLVLVCAGVTPNAELARAAGLEVDRGVVVDDHMRTSDPDIFAAGDVAQHGGRVYGLWPSAVEQAEAAAVNALGGARAYQGSVLATHLKVAGVDLASIGRPLARPGEDVEIVIDEAEDGRYRKLVLSDGGKIVGAILLGHPAEGSLVLAAISEGRDVRGHIDALAAGDWDVLNESHFENAVAAPVSRYRPESGPADRRPADAPLGARRSA